MKKTFCSRLFSMVLATAMVLSTFAVAFADSTGRFSDVPKTHWAYSNIEALAVGGLVNGVGDGKFDPDARLTIGQMATIIARAKGFETGTTNGKWYGKAVETGMQMRYIPNLTSNIADGTFDGICTRELAVYMVIEALGVLPGAKYDYDKNMGTIPDYGMITSAYADDVVLAVQTGIIKGVDSTGRFDPKGELTRAQICAILDRAGYRTATEPAKTDAEGKTNEQIYDAIKATGLFDEKVDGYYNGWDSKILSAKDYKYGLMNVIYTPEVDALTFEGIEFDSKYVTSENFENILDENGNVYGPESKGYLDANGKAVYASSFSYTGRQLLKQLFEIAFPNDVDTCINAMKSIMIEPYSYTGLRELPSNLQWINGHGVGMHMSLRGYVIDIDSLNETSLYERQKALAVTSNPKTYMSTSIAWTRSNDIRTMYELDRW